VNTDRKKWPPLHPGDRVSTAQSFEIIRKLDVASGQADLYLARLVLPKMLLSYQTLDRLMHLLGEPRWLLKHGRVFVLKVANPDKKHNLARELRFLNLIKVSHPHLIRLYEHSAMPLTEHGTERGMWPIRIETGAGIAQMAHALALEYLAGGSLNKLLAVYGDRLPPALAIEIALQVADGIRSLHDDEIIHQDLSPGNIMLRWQLSRLWPRKPEAVLIDLGVADLMRAEDRFGRSPYGKQIYLAPERAEHPYQLHYPADVFSLGAVLYHMLAGRPVAQKVSSSQTGSWVRTDFPPLRQQVPQISDDLNDLVMSALALNWKARPGLDELCAALRALPEARQPGRALGHWRIIDRVVAATIMILALLLVVFTLTTPWDIVPRPVIIPTVTPLSTSATPFSVTHTPTPAITSTAVR
jgi:serine/threonine protein kinase